MAWQFSNPLNSSLLASSTNQPDYTFGSNSLYTKPFYSSYDPLITKFKTRPNFYNRPTGSIDLFDDLDDLTLEVEANNLYTSRYKPLNTINYIPSYTNFNQNDNSQIPQQPPNPNTNKNKSQNQRQQQNQQPLIQQQFNQQQYFNEDSNRNQQPSPNYYNYQTGFQPIPFNNNPQIQPHNSQQQRILQYQQRMLQQQQQQLSENSLSELELLKIKQQQDRQQLLATIGQNYNQQQFQPNFQQNHFKYKQYSDTSIPSTNADPLNSNHPTPPLITQRTHRNNQDFDKNKSFKHQNNNYTHKTHEADESGSYLNALKDARLREQRMAKEKYTSNDYKKYQKNFGFGKDFLPFEAETKQEKLEKARKRDEYAKMIKERNTLYSNDKQSGSYANDYYYNQNPLTKRNQNPELTKRTNNNNNRVR